MADDFFRARNNQVLNNNPPNMKEDFGIEDNNDRLDKELMPDQIREEEIKQNSQNYKDDYEKR